ncbi:ABC transporter ATP-binding protein [Tsukamurella paurometabola]|uniref:ABC transporter ATP-binding protein n=1 Tax=Tsukamurella paurometabola TaxID=2061 RepID=A0ABS5NKS2_TSUPA|nr:ABC transporter ATP-binding protein [Tsukamurella paurometabola]MBS4104003.1 ABC transporter ATP-binding protein [Tsukamurella paurometabola]
MTLCVRGVSWGVGGRRIVDDVDLDARPGEVVGLLGPNGSGKSSLLRLLVGLRRPDSGSVELDGEDLAGMSRRAAARRIAFVEQASDTDQNPTVRDVIELGRIPHRAAWSGTSGHDRAIVAAVAAETELTDLLDADYHTLSGGERQRVHIARAFVQQPEVMVLDEPTNHLDVKHQLGLLGLVRDRVVGSGLTAVMALHDMNVAAMFCDRIVILRAGAVVADGRPEEVIVAETIREVFEVQATVHHDDGVHVRLRRG